jgi:methylated-DNA-protein-cysteine methyltransferase-like protein
VTRAISATAPGRIAPSDARARAILDRVRAVPEGFVRTYGDISPGAPRLAGTVLAGCADASVPWHRVVRADGSLAQGERQRALLDREGVPFRGSRVEMRVARMVVVPKELG